MPDETYTPSGVSFDGLHSYTDFGLWLMRRPSLGSPDAKISIVDIHGADGNIDLTEANTGEVKYGNRTLTFEFGAMVDLADQEAFRAKVMNGLHGKRISHIILDEDPDWYWTGRASVEFSDVQSWRLRCTVTVDAAPYALKTTETVVNFLGGQGSLQQYTVDIAENTSAQNWNSNFMLGTKDFPSGLPTSSLQSLDIIWGLNPTMNAVGDAKIQVVDADGGIYNMTVSRANVLTSIDQDIAYSVLQSNGITIDRVYRVLVQNVGGCRLCVTKQSVKRSVANSRKTVFPEFNLVGDSAVSISINGVDKTIPLGTGIYDDISLRLGTNEIYVPSLPVDVTTFTMKFREGKL